MTGSDVPAAAVVAITEFAIKAVAVASLVLVVLTLARLAPAPSPAPVIAPAKCDGSCRPAPAPLKCFDVICPYCRKRFTVDPNPNSTGALKDSTGKAYAKPVNDNRGLSIPKHRDPWYRRRFSEGPTPKLALNSGS